MKLCTDLANEGERPPPLGNRVRSWVDTSKNSSSSFAFVRQVCKQLKVLYLMKYYLLSRTVFRKNKNLSLTTILLFYAIRSLGIMNDKPFQNDFPLLFSLAKWTFFATVYAVLYYFLHVYLIFFIDIQVSRRGTSLVTEVTRAELSPQPELRELKMKFFLLRTRRSKHSGTHKVGSSSPITNRYCPPKQSALIIDTNSTQRNPWIGFHCLHSNYLLR